MKRVILTFLFGWNFQVLADTPFTSLEMAGTGPLSLTEGIVKGLSIRYLPTDRCQPVVFMSQFNITNSANATKFISGGKVLFSHTDYPCNSIEFEILMNHLKSSLLADTRVKTTLLLTGLVWKIDFREQGTWGAFIIRKKVD